MYVLTHQALIQQD